MPVQHIIQELTCKGVDTLNQAARDFIKIYSKPAVKEKKIALPVVGQGEEPCRYCQAWLDGCLAWCTDEKGRFAGFVPLEEEGR